MMFEIASDILLIAGSLGLAAYCLVLSHRLRVLSRSDSGLGASISELAKRVDALSQTTDRASADADSAFQRLAALTEEAERLEGELAFLLAGSDTVNEEDPPEEAPAAVNPIFSSRSAGLSR